MATTANFSLGVLTEIGDTAGNSIVTSRNVAGQLFVNGGAVPVLSGPATIANTSFRPSA
jgi:hypothetical protein